ncbi:MAG: flavin reductase [Lachnospiraceae bacterium]|nr:flavin reductase [Lachnospiraceae bacterium]MCD7842131.1 flavin reductase [Lachnospiraceae bacterium]
MFQEIKPTELNENVFDLIGKQWLLVTAGKPDGTCNTMTASWGGLGVMWGKNVAFLVIRPQRYTKEFIDSSETLSISVLPDGYKKQYGYLGSVSGRDEDKIAKTGLTVVKDGETPYFEEARLSMICRKLFAQPYDPEAFLDKKTEEDCYPQKDYHTLYICEIEKVLVKEQ